MEYKGRIPVQVKATDENTGEFRAVFSNLNVVDWHGDITEPGAFEGGSAVRILSFHNNYMPMIGRGIIHADDEKAWVDGRFFLEMNAAREHYISIKEAGDLQEWSYGFDILDSAYENRDGQEVRVLKKLKVYEVSPVTLGAGIGTHTEYIKSRDRKLEDEMLDVIDSVISFSNRVKNRAEIRSKAERNISSADQEVISKFIEAIRSNADSLEEIVRGEESKNRLIEAILKMELAGYHE